MDMQLIIIMAVAVGIVLPVVWLVINHVDKKGKTKTNTGFELAQQSKRHPIYRVYYKLRRVPVLNKYMDQLSRRYDILFPGDERNATKETIKTAGTIFVLCLVSAFFLFFRSPSILGGIVTVIMVFVINNEVVTRQVRKTEIRLLKQMSEFISNVRHNYYIHRMVDEAIEMSISSCGPEMKPHALKLLEVVSSNNLSHEVDKYNTATHNKYLKMMLSLCVNVIEYKDKDIDGKSLFTSNLEHLKKEVNIEVLKLEKIQYLFSGVVFVTMAACLAVGPIRSFAIDMVPNLSSFYDGRAGHVYVLIVYLTTVVIYLLTNQLRETKQELPKDYSHLEKYENFKPIKKMLDNYTEKNYGKMLMLKENLRRIGEIISPRQFILKRLQMGLYAFAVCLAVIFFLRGVSKNNLINNVYELASMENMSTNVQVQENMEETTRQYLNYYKDKEVSEETLASKLLEEEGVRNSATAEELAEIIHNKIASYKEEYFKWYELLLCFIGAIIGYFIPLWSMYYKRRIRALSMEDEVNQFNSIIYMMMYIDHMSVKDILIELEIFAVIFKQSLQECINEYGSGDIEALQNLKEKESYEPFKRMVDNFIRCDIIPIDKAFDEIASDRENYHDRRKQENEISVQKRADIAKPLSFVPAVLVVAYLIVPLMWASVQELSGFSEMMNEL